MGASMAYFRYTALDKSGQAVMGAMQAATEAEVAARLVQMGYQPQSVFPAPGHATAQPAQPPRRAGRAAGVNAQAMAVFFRGFAALQKAGIAPFQALSELSARTQHPILADAAGSMAAAVRSGGRLSDAMEQFSHLFPPHVVGAVRAGELGGFLPIVLDEVALQYEQEMAFYKGIGVAKSFVWQGIIALAVAQPVFPALFPEPHWDRYLELLFLRNLPILAGLVLLARFAAARWRRPENARMRDHWALRYPVFGDLERQRALAAFVRMLHRLTSAGISPVAAWEGAVQATPNSLIRSSLGQADALIKQGMPLHEAFRATGLFATDVESLLATGIMSGQVVEMLSRVADYYQSNLDRAFSNARFWMFRLFVIAALIVTGAVIILLVKTYFDAVFSFGRSFFPELNQ
ncbi:MAG: type II secretion system F family protein [Chthonomonadales bacterium]